MEIKLPAIIDDAGAGGRYFTPFWFFPFFIGETIIFEIKGQTLILKNPLNSSLQNESFNLENMSKLLVIFKRYDYLFTKNYGLNPYPQRRKEYVELSMLSATEEKHILLSEIIYNSRCKKIIQKLLNWFKSNTKLLIEENHLKVKEEA